MPWLSATDPSIGSVYLNTFMFSACSLSASCLGTFASICFVNSSLDAVVRVVRNDIILLADWLLLFSKSYLRENKVATFCAVTHGYILTSV